MKPNRKLRSMLARLFNRASRCYVCKRRIVNNPTTYLENLDPTLDLATTVVHHHTSYYPELTIVVCASCHGKIHRTNSYPDLKPSAHDVERFYGPKPPTSRCFECGERYVIPENLSDIRKGDYSAVMHLCPECFFEFKYPNCGRLSHTELQLRRKREKYARRSPGRNARACAVGCVKWPVWCSTCPARVGRDGKVTK